MTEVQFTMYDKLQVNYKDGKGWLDYCTLKSADDFAEAVRIVKGGKCHALPHWIQRKNVQFRILDEYDNLKLSE